MAAGDEREALLRVADRLSIELGYTEGADAPRTASYLDGVGEAMTSTLDSEDELLVARMRRGLTRIAVALGADDPVGPAGMAVGAALDSAEMVMRGELGRGDAGQLPALMPSFVFLVALPIVEQDEALELSRRTSELIEEVQGGL